MLANYYNWILGPKPFFQVAPNVAHPNTKHHKLNSPGSNNNFHSRVKLRIQLAAYHWHLIFLFYLCLSIYIHIFLLFTLLPILAFSVPMYPRRPVPHDLQ